jgi:hypothetical protein
MPEQKKNYCTAGGRFKCHAYSIAEQKTCDFHRRSTVEKHERCLCLTDGRCQSKEARRAVLAVLVNLIRNAQEEI